MSSDKFEPAAMSDSKQKIPIPSLPPAAHPDVESMLSRKFGKEVANYFSGSPLNRLSFLRGNHKFISAALTHPSTKFLLSDNLSPAATSPDTLHWAKHDDIRSLIGNNPFEKEEEQLIKEYRSDITTPLVLFLGVNENEKNGWEYEIYKGTPYFAVDITPKGTVEEPAKKVIETLKAQGLTFLEGRWAMHLNAQDGNCLLQYIMLATLIRRLTFSKLRYSPKPGLSWIGTLARLSVRAVVNQQCL